SLFCLILLCYTTIIISLKKIHFFKTHSSVILSPSITAKIVKENLQKLHLFTREDIELSNNFRWTSESLCSHILLSALGLIKECFILHFQPFYPIAPKFSKM
ncbi:hypothetical protein V8G54_030896, partial [Vigna mungo]